MEKVLDFCDKKEISKNAEETTKRNIIRYEDWVQQEEQKRYEFKYGICE